ncbi:D-Ala-D-Ala carboxypeptidase family metallohydrolase [Magnetococcus sp. PR-3]|uniref:D-Ala-D-Ala carboxypeptidase family metallohydrolase n=1 Tax=Magnetococcus sp. PR-3 TaxID=3120355 RepID=UPI002FCE30DA
MDFELNHFEPHEFACACCGQHPMDFDFAMKLDHARHLAGVPFKITSGYRCEKHNAFVGGKPGSSHTKGCAVDIEAADSHTRFRVMLGLIQAGFNRMGIDSDRGFIHVDSDPDKPKNVTWGY